MKYLLYYESAPDVLEKAPIHGAAHNAYWQEYAKGGTLLMIGPFSDRSGALGIFTTREAAEAFAKDDPFVLNGVVATWHVREWVEVAVPE